MIKTLLAPYETYLWAALAFILLIGGIYTVHHLENIGVQRQQAADAKLAQAQQVHTAEVEKRAQELVSASGSQLHNALVAPDPVSPFVVRVCPDAPAPRPVVPASPGPVAGSASPTVVVRGSVGNGGSAKGVDIAPGTRALLSRCDAEVAYWRQYYAACKAEGSCK